jgi:ADP-ribose pyrophosphatase YjhB (NUDIX family)
MSISTMTTGQRLGRIAMPFYMAWSRFSRGMTLGVRAAVFDREDRVFLVKHTYVPGWYLPGGGVEVGETIEQALARELAEEGHIRLEGMPSLLGIYHNREASRRDHVAFFVARRFTQERPRLPDREIAEAGLFPVAALPEDVTAATRRRLDEVAGRRVADGLW